MSELEDELLPQVGREATRDSSKCFLPEKLPALGLGAGQLKLNRRLDLKLEILLGLKWSMGIALAGCFHQGRRRYLIAIADAAGGGASPTDGSLLIAFDTSDAASLSLQLLYTNRTVEQ